MKQYRRFLQCLLAVNIMFILVAAGLGYKREMKQQDIAEVSNALEAKGNVASNQVEQKVVPVGKTVGIYVNTKGILVIDTGEVTDMEGNRRTPAKNRLLTGDYITKLNGEKMKTKKQLIEAITGCDGQTLVFCVERGGKEMDVKIEPVETEPGLYKVGIWVRDDLQGLGTVTYLSGNQFGALGHSINDMDTGSVLDVSGGEIYDADIFGVEKGISGTPGEIEGMIAYQTEKVVGEIDQNRLYGIFGTVTEAFQEELGENDAVSVAACDEVKTGTAYIQSYVSGKKELYEIEIVNIHKNDHGDQEMEIIVTDDNLLSLTGGIVQGMFMSYNGSNTRKSSKIKGLRVF